MVDSQFHYLDLYDNVIFLDWGRPTWVHFWKTEELFLKDG